MARQLYPRMVSAAGFLALSLVILGVDPFLVGSPQAGTDPHAATPALSVQRDLKGDRLPLSTTPLYYVPNWQEDFDLLPGPPPGTEPRAQIPFGCDPAFSPIAVPSQANVYRRCTA